MKKLMILLIFPLSACASIVDGSKQEVWVETSPVKASTCQLSNDKGQWAVESTPAKVTLQRSLNPLTVACEGHGAKGQEKVQSKTKGMAFGNILLGGPIGAAIDIGSGAAYDYPETIMVKMTSTTK